MRMIAIELMVAGGLTAAAEEDTFTTPDGVELHYVDWGGTGRNLVLLPGGCDTAWIFGDIAPRLARVARVTSLTPRGCGVSGRPETGYGIANHVADVAAFMDKLGVPKAVLAGHALGGGKINQFAMKWPGRVERVVYLDTAFGYVAPGLEEKMAPEIAGLSPVEGNFRVTSSGRLERRGKAPANSRKELTADLKAGAYSKTKIIHPALMIFAMDTYRGWIQNFPAGLKKELLPLVEDTQRRRKQEIAAFAANGKHVRIVRLRHTAPYCFVQRPDRVVQLMTDFLAAP